jgi:thioredoxin 1
MKNLILFTIVAGSLLFVAAKWNLDDPTIETSIQFSVGTFNAIVERAKSENKVIFMDIYATWCGPCKLLKRTTFTDKEVGNYFNTHFINIAVDGETAEGKKLREQYEVRSYPTMLFINPDGSIKEEAVGYHTASQLLKIAKKATN